MPKENITYNCEYCNKLFYDKKECTEHEQMCQKIRHSKEFQDEWINVFVKYHENSNRYISYCPICEIKLIEYDRCYDGHRDERGKCIYSIPYTEILGTKRCLSCTKKFKEKLLNLIKKVNPHLQFFDFVDFNADLI